MLLWAVAVIGLVAALAALVRARRLACRPAQISAASRKLRYDHTRLRLRVARLDPEEADEGESPAETAQPPSVAFVPLSSLRKKEQ